MATSKEKPTSDKARWSDELISMFIKNYKNVAAKSTSEGSLKKQEWKKVTTSFNSEADVNYDNSHFKSN